jgi:hypothetical protein
MLLPFVLRKTEGDFCCFAADEKYLDALLKWLRIMNLCMAFELKTSDAERLWTMIKDFHEVMLRIPTSPCQNCIFCIIWLINCCSLKTFGNRQLSFLKPIMPFLKG